MHRTILAIVAALIAALGLPLLAPVAQAQGNAPDARRQMEQAPKRGFWWEATRGTQRVYLMGTLHVGRAEFYPPALDAVQRLQQAAVIAVEADVFNAAKVAPVVQRLAFYGDAEAPLDRRIAPELKQRIESIVQKSDGMMKIEQVWRMKPWMLANTLVLLEAVRAGLSPAYATEAFLFGFSQASGKPIAELESIELQLSLFDSAPADMQQVYLEQVVGSIESGESQRELLRLVEAWQSSDAAAMEALIEKMRSGTAEADRFIMDRIIDGRHPKMVAGIEKMAASGKLHVIALGSLHYFGPNGVLALLRQRGFAIKPL